VPAASADRPLLLLPAFRQGLNAQGYIEGRNVTVEYRWADGQYDRVPEFAVDLVRRSVALIVAVGSPGTLETRVAQAVGTTALTAIAPVLLEDTSSC
jgi:putative ABC transport system substrate-binding protein